MIDVGDKKITKREAVAEGEIILSGDYRAYKKGKDSQGGRIGVRQDSSSPGCEKDTRDHSYVSSLKDYPFKNRFLF